MRTYIPGKLKSKLYYNPNTAEKAKTKSNNSVLCTEMSEFSTVLWSKKFTIASPWKPSSKNILTIIQ